MPANYVLLSEQTVSAPVTSVTFSNIPQTGYTDLVVKVSTRCTGSDTSPRVQFNATSGSSRFLYGNGSSALSALDGSNMYVVTGVAPSTYTANTFSNAEMYIPNYTNSSYKSSSTDGVVETNATESYSSLNANLWSNTNAITSITFSLSASVSFVANSTFSLYGVSALGTNPVVAPKATGGNIVTNDGTYWYHAFLTSGTFTPSTALNCDVLAIAGGGGAGGYGSGGAGAGGVIYFAGTSLAANTGYTTTIGAGGSVYGNGNNTTFGALTAAIGGGGSNNPGNAGGSGAGCGQGSGAVVSGGASTQTGTGATAFYGNAGGNAVNSGNFVGGGGGGAGAAGTSPASNGRGNGGNGTDAFSSWGLATATGQNVSGTVYYAGGGGGSSYFNPATSGGSGGAGGGGNGCTVSEPSKNNTPGTANTGGGGGATQSNQPPDANSFGGSGIVLVRYLMA